PIRCISNTIPLPVISNILFVQDIDFDLVKYLAPGAKTLSEGEALRLAIDALPQQERFIVRNLIEYIKERQRYIPASVLDRLETISFVIAGDSKISAPKKLLDPVCEAASLYSPNDRYVPKDETRIVDALRTLGAFKTTIDPEMALERIEFISSHSDLITRHNLAMKLFSLIQTSSFNLLELKVDDRLEWVPSDDFKVVRPSECYDPLIYPLSLFNRVAKVIQPSLIVSLPLRSLLGWNVAIRRD
ncbi:9447_t:CDS:1, partial [Acaulospora colombiana]